MEKIFLSIALFYLLSILLIPVLASAQGLVPCGNPGQGACTIGDFFIMLVNIYKFIVFMIATPLAVIALTIGGILMMISTGNPKWLQMGRDIFWAAVIGLVLVFCSWVIINFIMTTLGYSLGNWWQL